MKTWNLGNTTVRNPERIQYALRVFKHEFEGKIFDIPTQNDYFKSLIKEGIIQGDPAQTGSRDWSARKWASAFKKLGFALPQGNAEDPHIIITAAGNELISGDTLASDIYLRQMLKIQLPSPTESSLNGAAIHPFYLVLSVAVELIEQDLKPLGKEEIALYIQSATRNDQAKSIAESIRSYRMVRDQIAGRVGKRAYFLEQLRNKAKQLYGTATKQKLGTLQDYSDTTVRYASITGIFTIGRQSLVIKEDQIELAKAIIEAGTPKILDDDSFWKAFHDPSLPILPTDDADFLERDISVLYKKLNALAAQTNTELGVHSSFDKASIPQLKKRREALEEELTSLKEIQFYRIQHASDQVEDIKGLFESIEKRETIGGSDYRPAWAEWAVWRAFLSINTIVNPINETRGFKINSELFPIHHAKSGAADLCFEYEGEILVPVEITLSSNERQFNMEGEAVKFHVKSIIESHQTSEVIGIFTAPDIHVSTAHEFYGAEFYSQILGKPIALNIIPLTFAQLQTLLPGGKNSCSSSDDLLQKIGEIVDLKSGAGDGAVWLSRISDMLA